MSPFFCMLFFYISERITQQQRCIYTFYVSSLDSFEDSFQNPFQMFHTSPSRCRPCHPTSTFQCLASYLLHSQKTTQLGNFHWKVVHCESGKKFQVDIKQATTTQQMSSLCFSAAAAAVYSNNKTLKVDTGQQRYDSVLDQELQAVPPRDLRANCDSVQQNCFFFGIFDSIHNRKALTFSTTHLIHSG